MGKNEDRQEEQGEQNMERALQGEKSEAEKQQSSFWQMKQNFSTTAQNTLLQ